MQSLSSFTPYKNLANTLIFLNLSKSVLISHFFHLQITEKQPLQHVFKLLDNIKLNNVEQPKGTNTIFKQAYLVSTIASSQTMMSQPM